MGEQDVFDQPDRFDPEAGTLRISLPLCPPDNNLKSMSQHGKFPTVAYKEWLRASYPLLAELLGEWTPDGERWWAVRIRLRLGGLGDGANYVKATLDLLSGAQINDQRRTIEGPRGPRTLDKGAIWREAGFWDDDRRVAICTPEVVWVRHPDPRMVIECEPCEPPRDWKAEEAARIATEKEAAKAEQQRAREEKVAAEARDKAERATAREAERARVRAEKEAAKEAARAARAGR